MATTDYFTGKPKNTSNPNVPSSAEIIGESRDEQGVLDMTYYCEHYNPPRPGIGRWAFWKVGYAPGSEPESTCMSEFKDVLLAGERFRFPGKLAY